MIRLCTLTLMLALMLTLPVAAEDNRWRVDPDFAKKARKDISGAACTGTRCIAVNDEKNEVQEFTIRHRRLKPGKRIRLLDKGDEIDAEAIAVSDGIFYVTGSHGLSRKKAKLTDAAFTLFRIDGERIDSTARLRKLITETPALKDYAEKPLNRNGVNIEGLAAQGDTLYFGLRGPSVKGTAFVLQASAGALFSDAPLDPVLHTLALGDRIGIRDMAATGDGILILTGPVNTLPRRYTVALWHPGTAPVTLAKIPRPERGKPEGLLLLSEDDTAYDVLIFHDGPRNGAPVQLSLDKP